MNKLQKSCYNFQSLIWILYKKLNYKNKEMIMIMIILKTTVIVIRLILVLFWILMMTTIITIIIIMMIIIIIIIIVISNNKQNLITIIIIAITIKTYPTSNIPLIRSKFLAVLPEKKLITMKILTVVAMICLKTQAIIKDKCTVIIMIKKTKIKTRLAVKYTQIIKMVAKMVTILKITYHFSPFQKSLSCSNNKCSSSISSNNNS